MILAKKKKKKEEKEIKYYLPNLSQMAPARGIFGSTVFSLKNVGATGRAAEK